MNGHSGRADKAAGLMCTMHPGQGSRKSTDRSRKRGRMPGSHGAIGVPRTAAAFGGKIKQLLVLIYLHQSRFIVWWFGGGAKQEE